MIAVDDVKARARERRLWLAPKLRPPLASPFDVRRTELCEQLFAAGAARLVLLHAPDGQGKTTVMQQARQRFEQSGIATAWLTLDVADNDVGRFLSVLATALDRVLPGVIESDEPSQGRAVSGLALGLLDRVAAHPAPLALFLDDLEVVHNPAVLGLIQALIDQLPRGGQVITASRERPEVGLTSLGARGRLLEIDAALLRFSLEEADVYLRERHGLALSGNDVRLLHRTTEGWPMGLCLAAVSLHGQTQPSAFIAGFSAASTPALDYLTEQLLARVPQALRGFLLRTSIAGALSASLCDALCGGHTGAASLEQLRSLGLAAALQGDTGWHRCHKAFASALRAELQQRMPQELPQLHRAAADWYLQLGRKVPAIDHALASGEMTYALPLLAAHAEVLLAQARMRLLTRWLDPLAQAGRLRREPLLQAVHAWAVLFSRRPREALPLLDAMDADSSGDEMVAAHRLAMRPTLLTMMDRIEDAQALSLAGVTELPSRALFPRAVMALSLAAISTIAGRYSDAHQFADAGRRLRNLTGGFDTLFEAVEAGIDLTQGRLRQATQRLRLATDPRQADAMRTTQGNALAGVLLAEALYEADETEQAERLLAVYVPLIMDMVWPDQLTRSHVLLARVVAARGDTERAFALLTELEYAGHRGALPRAVAAAKIARARLLLAQDQAVAAAEELERAGDAELWSRVARLSTRANDVETRELMLLRCRLRTGGAAQVLQPLQDEIDIAGTAQHVRRALTARLLLAEALWRTHRAADARRPLAEALALAGNEGYVRPFIDEGQAVADLLNEFSGLPSLAAGGDALPGVAGALFERMRWAAERAAAASPVGGEPSSAAGAALLTRKEVQVLQLLAEGLSNHAIGERMFVAPTTVRTHLRNINVKLDAHNRTEAVAIARRLGLIR